METYIAQLLEAAEHDTHSRLTSAIAFCLGSDTPYLDTQLLRLAALSHESSIEMRGKLTTDLPQHADFLSQAWGMLTSQTQALACAASPADLAIRPPDDEALSVLYWSHMAASPRLGGAAKYTDHERQTVKMPTKEQMAQHPLLDQGRVALVYGGATKIKGYVFESARLPEVRGASALFDRINLYDVPALWGAKNEQRL